MGRILRLAEKIKEKKQLEDTLKILYRIEEIIKREDLSDAEKQKMKNEILDKKITELKQMINFQDVKTNEKAWNFTTEKNMKVFLEDEQIILRGYREEDNDYIRQIKKENSSSPDEYNNDEAWKMSSEWLTSEHTFVCSILNKKDEKYIGYVAIKNTGRNLWEIAMELLEEQCKKGYGARALALFLPSIHTITGKTQFQALVETDNIPSQKLVEKLGARLIDIYDYTFKGDEEAAEAFEKENLDKITDRMIELAEQIGVEPRKMLSNVLDYRFFLEEGKILYQTRCVL